MFILPVIVISCKMTPAPPLKLVDLPGLDQRFMDDSLVSDLNLHSLH